MASLKETAAEAIDGHFRGCGQSTEDIVCLYREYPHHARGDIDFTIFEMLEAFHPRLVGVQQENFYSALTISELLKGERKLAPLQYEEVDIGAELPSMFLKAGLWLAVYAEIPFIVLYSQYMRGPKWFCQIEVGYPLLPQIGDFARKILDALEKAARASRNYRGKILSLETGINYSTSSGGLLVHRFPLVGKESVILDNMTMGLIDNNVFDFDACRVGLRALGQSTRKGILLYGPPGTGKTHIIRYIATNLKDHTTFIITAAQVGRLSEYMALARELQPSIVVLEDVDLIGKTRESMTNTAPEVLLNALLNEMDGLREDADILFVLTTNHADKIEDALSSRPGRIDQAIEIPLPDSACRRRLLRLYGSQLIFAEDAVELAVERTAGVSAAFIKELVRRMAQLSLMQGVAGHVSRTDVGTVLENLLIAGSPISRRILGADALERAH